MIRVVDNLVESIQEKQSPIVVGLDTTYENVPLEIKSKYNQDLGGAADAILEFNMHVIDAVSDVVPAIKPQTAFFELYGWSGIRAFEETVAYAKSKRLIVIEDAKRGDIGSTSEAYANAHLGTIKIGNTSYSNSEIDFMTVSPFLGLDSLEPFIRVSRENNKGLFILVRTSNPGSSFTQTAMTKKGITVAEELAEYIASNADNCRGNSGYSSIGAVVGATYPEEAIRLRALMKDAFFLVPGYGFQGGTAKDAVPFFNRDGLGALISSSRNIIYAYKNKYQQTSCSIDELITSTRSAAQNMREEIYSAIKKTYSNISY